MLVLRLNFKLQQIILNKILQLYTKFLLQWDRNEVNIFSRFPKDQLLREKWIEQIGRRGNFEPTLWATVCSAHFTKDSFIQTKSFRFLRKNAVPTVFHPHRQKSRKLRSIGKVLDSQNLVINSIADCEIKIEVIIGGEEDILGQTEQPLQKTPNHHNYDLPNQKELKRRNDSLCEEIKVVKKQLELAEKTIQYFQKKCASLNDVIKALKSKNLVLKSAEEFLSGAGSRAPAHLFQRLRDCKKPKSNWHKPIQ